MSKHHSEDYKITDVKHYVNKSKIYQKLVKYLNALELV